MTTAPRSFPKTSIEGGRLRKQHQPHWYLISIHTCPVCGHEEVYRKRRYVEEHGPKPDNPYDHSDVYDNCMDFVYGV